MTIVFFILKKTIGLRVSREVEIAGLDSTEHNLPSAYADFMPMLPATGITGSSEASAQKPAAMPSMDEAVPVKVIPTEPAGTPGASRITKVTIITRQSQFEALKAAMEEIGVNGMTVTNVLGCGMQKGAQEYYRGVKVEMTLLPKIQVDIVVTKVPVEMVIATAKQALYTGHIGDGKIFVYHVENVVKVRTGEEGYDALQDD